MSVREYPYKSYFIRVEEHSGVFIARIFKDLTDPPLAHIETGPRAVGLKPVLDASRQYIDQLYERKDPPKRG